MDDSSDDESIGALLYNVDFVITDAMRRHAIAFHYLRVLNAPEPDEWKGKGGTISTVLKALKLHNNSYRTVERVLKKVWDALCVGMPYNDERSNKGGRTCTIKNGSFEQQMIADCIERGLGMTETTYLVNSHLKEDGVLIPLSRSAVYSAHLAMKPKTEAIKKASQGDSLIDPTDPKAIKFMQARYNWIRHLLVRFGLKLDCPDDAKDEDGNTFDWLDPDTPTLGCFTMMLSS